MQTRLAACGGRESDGQRFLGSRLAGQWQDRQNETKSPVSGGGELAEGACSAPLLLTMKR